MEAKSRVLGCYLASKTLDSSLRALIQAGVTRLFDDLSVAPALSRVIRDWISAMFGPVPLEEVFLRPEAFPVLLLPWWLEESVRAPDLEFQGDLVASSISGYLFIRLVDNVMDGDAPGGIDLLAALGPLHTLFSDPYRRWFPPAHPFWRDFRTIWFQTAEVTLLDRTLATIDRTRFEAISARKTGATKIPIAAVAYGVGRPEVLEPWFRWVDLFGSWHQMRNDLIGWPKDLEHGNVTLLNSEGRGKCSSPDSLYQWFADEGFGWAANELEAWMTELEALSPALESVNVLRYLRARRRAWLEEAARIRAGLGAWRQLAQALSPDR